MFIGVSAGMVHGVPVTSLIATATSLNVAMSLFAIVNAIVFITTLFYVPSMPVSEKVTYGAQFSVLKKSTTWLSIAAVIFMNGAVFGVYSYLAEYLEAVTKMTWNTISILLFIYGVANQVSGQISTSTGLRPRLQRLLSLQMDSKLCFHFSKKIHL
ncbi:hypothetical protein [uncultured Brevibacillus sp.]|uniref:hypothetical protein n=1 Tax=uncultured Brevibacillus sp. TaxID=169970 RepID=UPI00338F3E90